MSKEPDISPLVHRLVRASVILAIVGLLCVLLFLWEGFHSWTVGVGVFLGAPVVCLSIILYLSAVVIDLRQRDVI
jgi:hypothetical protein